MIGFALVRSALRYCDMVFRLSIEGIDRMRSHTTTRRSEA